MTITRNIKNYISAILAGMIMYLATLMYLQIIGGASEYNLGLSLVNLEQTQSINPVVKIIAAGIFSIGLIAITFFRFKLFSADAGYVLQSESKIKSIIDFLIIIAFNILGVFIAHTVFSFSTFMFGIVQYPGSSDNDFSTQLRFLFENPNIGFRTVYGNAINASETLIEGQLGNVGVYFDITNENLGTKKITYIITSIIVLNFWLFLKSMVCGSILYFTKEYYNTTQSFKIFPLTVSAFVLGGFTHSIMFLSSMVIANVDFIWIITFLIPTLLGNAVGGMLTSFLFQFITKLDEKEIEKIMQNNQ